MTIKHLVLPGGGAASIRLLGALKKLHENDIWNEKNLESVHSVSAGTLLAVLIALKFDMDTIVDYMIGRPWDNVFQISLMNIFDVFAKKGFFGTETIETFMKPFFNTRDISLDITMQQFYELTGVKLFFYAVEINSFQLINISNETFPDLPVLKAIHMSAAYPLLLSPVILDGKCYVDGGIITNYPITQCLKIYPDKAEVLGIGGSTHGNYNRNITEDTTLFEYLLELIYKIVVNVYERRIDFQTREDIPNYVEIEIPSVTITNLQHAFSDIEERKKLLNEGEISAQEFVEKKCVGNCQSEKEDDKSDGEDLCSKKNDTSDTPWCFDNMPIV